MRILIAEDERITRRKLRKLLEQMGHEITEAADGQEAWELFQSNPSPIVVSDWEMPEVNGVELVRRIRAHAIEHYVYIVMLTGKSEKQDVVEAIEAGADDFVSKPFDRDELRARLNAGQRIIDLEHHLATANDRLRHELAVARELSDVEHRKHEEALLGDSVAIRSLRDGIQFYSGNEDALMLSGPSGAGQEAVARAIHRASVRRSRAFIYVDCAHVSATNDSIFGFQPSSDPKSVSTARMPRSGKAALADGGTLYLERLETLNEQSQAQLASFLIDSASTRECGELPVPDVRLIAYVSNQDTDGDWTTLIDERLAGVLGQCRLSVPSLAERKEDITTIAGRILKRRATSVGKTLNDLSSEAIDRLLHYSWPGNIRELHSVLDRSIMLATGSVLEIPEELVREGRRVGGYTLQRRLGQGGMGEVWLAQHSLLARPSAVKLIRQSSLNKDADTREMLEERFEREARATAHLRSPHTVELYDFGVTDEGDFYYVMEYLSGINLHSLVAQYGLLPVERTVYLLKQACISLGEAHQAEMVHRDIKPANLFVCKLGTQFDFLKLLDFGIVRSTEGKEEETSPAAGVIKGSPSSMSPEVVKGGEATTLSDIYGLGCVAYWLVTGHQVFDAGSVMGMLLKHASQAPKPPSEWNPELPKEIDEVILKCLAKDPADRPNDVSELARLLERIPVKADWGNQQARTWWESTLPDIDVSSASGDTSIEMDSKTKGTQLVNHPSDGDLWKWSRNELTPVYAAAIEDHIENCQTCGQLVDEIMSSNSDSGSFKHRVRDLLRDEDDEELSETVVLPTSPTKRANLQYSEQMSFANGTLGGRSDDWLGRCLGDFEVTRIVGLGDKGLVLKAHDQRLQRDVAIKVLSDEFADDETALNRLLAEARVAGQLDHANIVTIHEVVQAESLTYLVMEWVSGGNAQEHLSRTGAFSPGDATRILIGACQGLSAAHEAGLVHRDIKPASILLTGSGHAKVSDFGLAKQSESIARQQTLAGQLVQTPYYMSPEQCESAPVDARSDVYSLGATYFSLLTATRPFDNDDPVRVMLDHRESDPPDPRDADPSVPEVCSQIIEQSMAKQPAQRYQSMLELLGDLEAVMATVTAFQNDLPDLHGS
ncbi:MAG: protein kinase [Planctomycetota bacterium]